MCLKAGDLVVYWLFPLLRIEFVLLVSFRSCDGLWSGGSVCRCKVGNSIWICGVFPLFGGITLICVVT